MAPLACLILWGCSLTAPWLAGPGLSARDAADDRVLTHSAVVAASLTDAWAAFTTAEGLEAWGGMRVLALDFRVGGTIETSYDPDARAGDDDNIISRILSYEPERMYSGTFRMPPQFPTAREEGGHWSVMYFEPVDAGHTRITLSIYGWGEGEDWDKAYAFFEWGNAYSLELLRLHFAGEDDDADVSGGGNGSGGNGSGDGGSDGDGDGDGQATQPRPSDANTTGEPDAPRGADVLAEYAATLGAAEANLRAGDTAAAWRWLEAAPPTARGWEWRHLAARADVSTISRAVHAGAVSGLECDAASGLIVLASADGTASVHGESLERTLSVLEGHEGSVYRAVFRPRAAGSERQVATAGQDGTARLWRVDDGALLNTFWDHDHPISAVAFSPDGALLATSSYVRHRDIDPPVEGMVKLWDVATGAETMTLRHGGHTPLTQIVFTPDGAHLAASTWSSRVYVWALDRPEQPRALAMSTEDDHMHLNDVAISPDGARVAASDDQGFVFVWERESGATLWSHDQHAAAAKALAFTPDGRGLVTGCHDAMIRVWDSETGDLRETLVGHRGAVGALDFAADGTLWSADAQGVVKSWSRQGDRGWWDGSGVAKAFSLAFSPADGGEARVCFGTFIGDEYSDGPQVLQLRRLADGEVLWTSPDLGSFANAMAWRPGTDEVAVGLDDSRVELWDVARGERVAALEGPERQVSCIDITPDGALLAVGAYGGGVTVWDAETHAVVAALMHDGGAVEDVALSADGSRLLSAGTDGSVRLWLVDGGAELLRLTEQVGWATAAVFSPDGRQVLTGDQHGGVRRFDATTGTLRAELAGHAGTVGEVAFSPDGARILVASRVVRLHDAASGRELLTLRPPGRYRAWECEFSPDGETIGWTEWGGPVSLFRGTTWRDWSTGR